LTGATPTTTTSRFPTAPGIGPVMPSASPQSRVGLDLGAHCIYEARRQEGRCRSFERGASVGDPAVAGLVSRHGAAPGANCADPSNAGAQDRLVAQSGRHQSAFQDHSERIITLHTANGNRYWPTASADTSTSTPGAQVDRLSPLQSAARSRSQWRHIRLASRLIPVFSGVDSWFHLQCVFGVLLESGEGGKW
jgi:hypothetical protein